jgi:hypothetical protein
MHNRLRLRSLIILVSLSLACNRGGENPTTQKSAAATTSDRYVGMWVNLKDVSRGLSIQPESGAYLVANEDGQKYVATKTNGVLRISGPNGSTDVLYVKSSDHLVAAGEEYKRFDPNGPEAQRSAQRHTMADMRSIATAWEARATDTNSYSVDAVGDGEISYTQLSSALSPTYIKKLPRDDSWGTPFVLRVSAGGQQYSVRSVGSNRRFDDTPEGATSSPEADILFSNGNFVSCPEGTRR